MAIEVVRILMMACQTPRVSRITVRVNDKVAAYVNNRKRRAVMQIEEESKVNVQILGSEALFPEHFEIDCRDDTGNMIDLGFLEERDGKRPH
jgi:ribonuclease E